MEPLEEIAPQQILVNAEIEAVIIRADGTIENLGTVASLADGTIQVKKED